MFLPSFIRDNADLIAYDADAHQLLYHRLRLTVAVERADDRLGHVAPEAYVGGPIALVQNGDSITIDAHKRLIQLDVSDKELASRRRKWVQPKPRYTRGVLAKYMSLVSTASKGAVTD